jgi:hypothetical protein
MLLAVHAKTALSLAVPAQATTHSAPSAAIAAGRDDCPTKYVRLWVDRNFTGARWQSKNNNATCVAPGAM